VDHLSEVDLLSIAMNAVLVLKPDEEWAVMRSEGRRERLPDAGAATSRKHGTRSTRSADAAELGAAEPKTHLLTDLIGTCTVPGREGGEFRRLGFGGERPESPFGIMNAPMQPPKPAAEVAKEIIAKDTQPNAPRPGKTVASATPMGASAPTLRSRLTGLVGGLVAAAAVLTPVVAAFTQSQSEHGAAGVNLTGCTGSAASLGTGGEQLSTVAVPPGPASSPEHPFVVHRDGTVSWNGQSDTVIIDHHWDVSVYGIEVRNGGSANSKQETTANGVDKVNKYLPFPIVGLFHISGSLTGTGGICHGDMWVKVEGSPTFTPLWLGGTVLLAGGLTLAYFARPSLRKEPQLA
jgi:hypothetical protein